MDQDLVVQARDGDTTAFESLVVAHHHRLFRVAQGILRDPHLAEDATQQAFLDMWRGIRRLGDAAKFEAWSYRVLVRACYRELKRRPDWVPDTEMPRAAEPSAPDQVGLVEHRDELERGFRQLSVDHRTIIVLHHLMDMTLEKVAENLDIPLGTAHSRFGRAMKALRAAMANETRPRKPASKGERVST